MDNLRTNKKGSHVDEKNKDLKSNSSLNYVDLWIHSRVVYKKRLSKPFVQQISFLSPPFHCALKEEKKLLKVSVNVPAEVFSHAQKSPERPFPPFVNKHWEAIGEEKKKRLMIIVALNRKKVQNGW